MTAELENIHMLGLYAVLVPRVTLLSTYVTTLSPKDIFPPQQIDNSRHHDEVHLCPPCSFCLGLCIRACPTSCWYVVIKILFHGKIGNLCSGLSTSSVATVGETL